MPDSAVIKQLKQTNISADAAKTKERVSALWKSASSADKKEVTKLADIATSTVYRVTSTGSLSAKIAYALAQVLRENPFYLTAETDERGDFSEDVLSDFLTAHGYSAVAREAKRTRRRAPAGTRRGRGKAAQPKTAPEGESEAAGESDAEGEPEIEIIEVLTAPEEETASETTAAELTDADVLTLFHALKLKAVCAIPGAADALEKLYALLLG